MAVNARLVDKTLEDLEREVTCAVCQELFTDPRMLPCLHYYCKQCVLRLSFSTSKDDPLSCPECRKDTTLPEGGVDELKSAFIINRLKSMYLKHKKALSKQIQCEICDNSDALAEAFCQQCEQFACTHCVLMHSKMKGAFNGHKLVPIDQLQKVKAEELMPKTSKSSKCQVHSKSLKIFCFDCNKLICRDCTVKDHKDHNIEFNNVAADNKKKELTESIKSLKEVEESLSRALKEVCNTEHEVEIQGDILANTVQISFEELHTILETRKQQLLEEAKRRMKEKIENLKKQEKNLSIAAAEVCSVIDYAERYVRHCSDEEIMSLHTEISQRIQNEVKQHGKLGDRLEPVEEADMGIEVRCAEDLYQLCQKAKITHVANLLEVSNTPTMVEVDKLIKIEVFEENKKATKSRLHLQCQIKCVPTGAVIKPSIEVNIPDRYEISYTPSVRGQHEVLVSAYGQPVSGSPFIMTVYASPKQLDKPVKVWDGVMEPFSITVNSVEEIIVAEFNKAIIVLDNEGKILRRIEQSQHKINCLRSVAVDNDDNIYYIGNGSNKIGKANKNCDLFLVRDIQVKQIGTGYHDIAVVQDEVMVTEYFNKGYIMVYDRELNYVRQINSRNKTKLRCLYPDHLMNLYISDDDNAIQVLSKTGDFIRFIRHDHNVQQLMFPWMLHVCGCYVFVAHGNLKKIVVFTTEGDYVTTFGCYGGICTSINGNIYVGDYNRNKLNCY